MKKLLLLALLVACSTPADATPDAGHVAGPATGFGSPQGGSITSVTCGTGLSCSPTNPIYGGPVSISSTVAGLSNTAGSGTVPVTIDGSGDLGSSSLKDDGTSVTIAGQKLVTCTDTTAGGILSVTVTAACSELILTPSSSRLDLVGISHPTSGVRHLRVVNMGSQETWFYPLNSNAASADQFEGSISGSLGGWPMDPFSVYDFDYDAANQKWMASVNNDVGSLNVNGQLLVTASLIFGGDLECTASDCFIIGGDAVSSGTQNLDVNAAGTGVIRFNSGTGSVTNSGTGGVAFYSGGSASVQEAEIGSNGIQVGSASGPTITSGSSPSGSCVSGSVYLQTAGSIGFNACVSSAWVGFATATGGNQFLGEQVFTSGTSYSVTAGTTKIYVTMVGGGGGGGGANFGSTNAACGGGGGGGAIVQGWYSNASMPSTFTIAVGTGGTAGTSSGGQGGVGGDTTMIAAGQSWTAKGGVGGAGTATTAANGVAEGGFVPTSGSTGPTGARIGGWRGGACLWSSGTSAGIQAGQGADSPYGNGGSGPVGATGTGQPALGNGAGGGGGASTSGVGHSGGAGDTGIIIVDEYN